MLPEASPSVLFQALADPARLPIAAVLAEPAAACCGVSFRVCACDLQPLLGLAQPSHEDPLRCLAGRDRETRKIHILQAEYQYI